MMHNVKISILLSILFLISCGNNETDFQTLIQKLDGEEVKNRDALIEQFISQQGTFPIIEDSLVYYLYNSSQGNQPYLCGDMCSWDPDSIAMYPIQGTDYYYISQKYPSDARIEYKFVVEQNFFLDPLNPIKERGPVGTNSVLVMPDYNFPKEILINKSNAISTIDTIKFESRILKNTRDIFIYKTNIDKKPEAVVIFNDGQEYLRYANAQFTLDNLISENKIPPVFAVFVNPVNRMTEYWMNDDYLRMLFRELLPRIKRQYKINESTKVGLGGPSLGGLISVYALKKYQNELDFIFSQSGAFQIDSAAIINTIANLDNISSKLYFSYGTFEGLDSLHNRMATHLEKKQANYLIHIANEGHNWGNWRAHLGDALQFCLNGKGRPNEY